LLLGEFEITPRLLKLFAQVAEFGTQISFPYRLGAPYVRPGRGPNLDQTFVLEQLERRLSRVPSNPVFGSQLSVRREPRADREGHPVCDLLPQNPRNLPTRVALLSRLYAGVPERQVAEWAGHSVEVLRRVYSKILDGFDDIWFEKIDKVIGQR
jgi:hypothetical protein